VGTPKHFLPALTNTLAIFCKVVDNFGDIGICWRLSKQLRQEHGIAVTLWVDDLASFRRLCPEVDTSAATQTLHGVTVRHWRGQDGVFTAADVADVVIEFFAVDIPPGYVEAMAQRSPKPVWFNLEGLTAEEWVEGCHRLPSMHPRLPLTKHFFFPGFTAQTGGLLFERDLESRRAAFAALAARVVAPVAAAPTGPAARDAVVVPTVAVPAAAPADVRPDATAPVGPVAASSAAAFLSALGLTAAEQSALKISLFCYPHAPIAELFAAWSAAGDAITCLVPQGVADKAVRDFLGAEPAPGATRTHGALTLRVIPFLPQQDYDKLLWSCDLNFVRGEDSWVRAQWAQKPFVWHIYFQDENLHHKKLRAFLQRYSAGIAALPEFSLAWNGASENCDWPALWDGLKTDLNSLSNRAVDWQQQMRSHGDLATNLLEFARSLQYA